MRLDYQNWLVQRTVIDFNHFLNETTTLDIPELKIKIGDVKSIGPDLLKHYQKEVGIQAPFGGIRNPAMVLCNKIRHEFTNYDTVRDSMTRAVRIGDMGECEELELRLVLTKKVSNLVEAIINTLPCPINVANCKFDKTELNKANRFYTNKEVNNITTLAHQYRC